MWFVVAGVALFAAGMTAEYLIERAGQARARFDAQIAAFEQRIETNRTGRHSASQPRRLPIISGPGDPVTAPVGSRGRNGQRSPRVIKHAARSPRETPGGAMVPGENPGQPLTHGTVKQHPPAPSSRLVRDPGGPWYRKHPSPGTPPGAVTAADIAPVFLPAPGVSIPLRPQPGRDSGTGTTTMPRLTDTGELRAITERADAIIAGFTAGQDGAA